LVATWPSQAHEWYTGLHDKRGQLCCGANDCEPTHFRIVEGRYELQLRDGRWFGLSAEDITFLPVPEDNKPPFKMTDGSDDTDVSHRAHMCYVLPDATVNYTDVWKAHFFRVSNGIAIIFYCAFIPPQGY
jgi:hypothetical protein